MSDALSEAAKPYEIGGLSEVGESQPLDDGPYDFEVRSAKISNIDTKNGPKDVLQLVLVAAGHPDNDPVFDRIFLPSDEDSADDRKNAMRRVNRVFHAFQAPMTGDAINPQDLVGKTAHLKVKGKLYEGERQVNVSWPKVR